MSYELDDLGGGERPPTVAAAAPSSSSTDQRTCTVRRMFIVSVILAVLLVLAMIAIAVGVLAHYFEAEESPLAEESPPAEESPQAPNTLPSIGSKTSNDYYFHTKQITGSGDFANKKLNTINKTKKGPVIRVRNGERLWVKVTNGITESESLHGLSIHWHGLNMRGAQKFDGVVGLTQCPIAPGKSYVYSWKVNEQPGTYWYHTHDRKMYPEGQIGFIKGPLIIHEPDATIPESASQYSYQNGNEIILFYVMADGHGVLNGEEQPVIEVENGEYTFRIINGSGEKTYYFFSIGGSYTDQTQNYMKLKVVATDGYPVKPYETDMIKIAIAERYDVNVTFNISTPTKNVWIRANSNLTNGTFGVLKIKKNNSVPNFNQTNPPSNDKQINMMAATILNCYNTTYNCSPVTKLTSTRTRKLLDSFYYHTVDINMTSVKDGAYWSISIDRGLFQKNVIPCEAAIMKSSRNRWSNHTNVLSLPTSKSVTVVLRSLTEHIHPIHMHGHHYEVLEIATRKTDTACTLLDVNTAFSEPIDQLMKRPTQGVLKDTVMLPPCGAVALRFNSDNPGIWFFHCHIEYHLHHGLALVLDEGGYLFSQTKFPKDYPSCGPCDN